MLFCIVKEIKLRHAFIKINVFQFWFIFIIISVCLPSACHFKIIYNFRNCLPYVCLYSLSSNIHYGKCCTPNLFYYFHSVFVLLKIKCQSLCGSHHWKILVIANWLILMIIHSLLYIFSIWVDWKHLPTVPKLKRTIISNLNASFIY